jgi:hypothetical protein
MTEYRIIPCRTFIGDMYLQFKHTETITKRKGWLSWLGIGNTVTETREVWRFVPKEGYPKVHGYWLSQEACPSTLPFMHEAEFMHSFHQQEGRLKGFAQNYPDIQVYFDKLYNARKAYLNREKAAQNATVEYL